MWRRCLGRHLPSPQQFANACGRTQPDACAPLQVIHCVMYPRGDVDLPIVAFDMVARAGAVVFCCADASPVSMSRKLPPLYETMLT